MNPFESAAKTLPEIYGSWNPMGHYQAMQQIPAMNQWNQMQTQEQQQKLSLADAMNPLKLQQQQIENEQGLAQIPGMQADSKLRTNKARMSDATFDTELEGFMKEHRGKIQKADLEAITNAANAYSQAGPLLEAMPGVASHAAARQILGQFYRPEFDKVPPEALGKVVQYLGQQMSSAAPKFQQQLELVQQKALMDQQKERIKTERAKEIEEIKGNIKKTLADLNAKNKKDPTTAIGILHALQVKRDQAAVEGNMEMAMFYKDQMDEIANFHGGFIELQAAARKQGAVDAAAATGMPGIEKPVIPQAKPPNVPGSAPTATPQSSDRVRVQSPDGKTGTIPKAQLKEALEQGYKEIK